MNADNVKTLLDTVLGPTQLLDAQSLPKSLNLVFSIIRTDGKTWLNELHGSE